MADIELRNKILDTIRSDEYNLDSLRLILQPASNFFGNRLFLDHVEKVVRIIVTDRNDDKHFDTEDLKLLGGDILSVTNLITSIMLLVGALPDTQLQYNPDATEELILKILVYIFVVMIPKETNKKWTLKEKEAVLDLTLTIYHLIRSSQVTRDIIRKVQEWFKTKGWCSCICGTLNAEDQAEAVVNKQMPKIEWKLKARMYEVRDKRTIMERVQA